MRRQINQSMLSTNGGNSYSWKAQLSPKQIGLRVLWARNHWDKTQKNTEKNMQKTKKDTIGKHFEKY